MWNGWLGATGKAANERGEEREGRVERNTEMKMN